MVPYASPETETPSPGKLGLEVSSQRHDHHKKTKKSSSAHILTTLRRNHMVLVGFHIYCPLSFRVTSRKGWYLLLSSVAIYRELSS
jgi:hypothetical protein